MFLWCTLVVLLVVGVGETVNEAEKCPNIKTDLGSSRMKRHLTFPDGSNIVLTISLVKAFMTHAPAGWNFAMEIDVLFPLPDANFTNINFRRKLHRRQKRDFLERLKNALDVHNFDGHSCVLRSICEARTRLAPPGMSLIHDILRAVFTFPDQDDEISDDTDSYNELQDPRHCEKENHCPFSLVNFVMALNK